ncbi:MAG: efflux RND transporter periplasmic adaptor subunit [Muribaculaceae bacterium]|nr:efflux RND transporter periplasmic adaptor subunit [Muribaculaceae bacterium]
MKTAKIVFLFATGMALTASTSCGFKKEKETVAPPVKVTVLPVSDVNIASGRNFSGTVVPGDGAEVSFPVPGTVKAVYVTDGQKVHKGQLLAELNDGTLQNNYNIAQAALAEAQDAYNRFEKLHNAKALADMKWVEVQNALKTAQNSAEVARRALGDAKIYAPVSGIVSDKTIEGGQNVLPAIPAMKIVALNNVKVAISVPENEISALPDGLKADITVEALDNSRINGTLTEKNVVADPLTRTYTAKFTVDNSNGRLLPGMLCTVALPVDTTTAATAAIVLPPQSVLLSADNRNFVWLASGSKAEQRFVTVGDITAEGIVISQGLAAGDSVIIAGMPKVSNGTPVIAQ